MRIIDKIKWQKIKKHLPTLVVSFFSSIAVLYSYFENHYDNIISVKTQELELDYQKEINLLDLERSRIVIEIGEEKSIFDFDGLFVDGSNISNNYIKLEGSPFAVPKFHSSDAWEWQKTNLAQLAANQGLEPPPDVREFFKMSKLNAFIKDEYFDLTIREKKISLQPMITFEHSNTESIKTIMKKFIEQNKNNETFSDITEENIDDLIDESINGDGDFLFNSFFNVFSTQKDHRISDHFGKLVNTEYYFNKNVFLINGYYNVEEASNNKLKKWYILRLGIMKENDFYVISFNVPVDENYTDLKLFNTLVHGVKIIK